VVVNLAKLMITVGANLSEAEAGLSKIQKQAHQVADELTSFGTRMTAAFTVPTVAMAALGASFVVTEQRAKTALTSITGSAETANKTFEQMIDLADKFGVKQADLLPMAQRLIGVGVAADEAAGAMEIMLNTAAGAKSATMSTEEAMMRLTTAFSQMIAKGKLTAEEMTQQAGEVFPAWQLLAEQMGTSVAELQDRAKKGALSAAEALPELFEAMRKKYGEIGIAIGELLPGAFARLQNAAERALGSLMGPSIEQLTNLLNSLYPVIVDIGAAFGRLDPEVKKLIVTFGAIIAAIGPLALLLAGITVVITALISPVGLVVSALAALAIAAAVAATAFAQNWGGIRDKIMGALNGIAPVVEKLIDDAFTWGSNLIISFANGMADAVSFIADVLNAIADTISGWLEPGSPPKLLPDIDKWGALAMQEYMKGWLNADFGVFNEISKMIEERLRFVARAEGGDLAEMIFGSRAALMQAMNDMREFGQISEDTMQAIADSSGSAAGEIQGIIETYIEWVQAGEDVARIQKEITQINRQFAAELRPLQSEMDKINDAQQELADQERMARLAEQVAKGKADPKELSMLAREIELRKQIRDVKGRQREATDAKQAELEAAEGVRDALQPQIDAFKNMNKYQQDSIRLMDEFTKATGGAGGGAKKAGAELDKLGEKFKLNVPTPEKIEAKFREMWDKIKEGWDKALAPINTFLARIDEGLKDPFKEIATSLESIAKSIETIRQGLGLGGDLEAGAQRFLGPGGRPGEQDFAVQFPELSTGLQRVGEMMAKLGEIDDALWSIIGEILNRLGGLMMTTWDNYVVPEWRRLMQLLGDAFTILTLEPIRKFAEVMHTYVIPILEAWAQFIQGTLLEVFRLLGVGINTAIATFADLVIIALTPFHNVLVIIEGFLKGDFDKALKKVKDNFDLAWKAALDIKANFDLLGAAADSARAALLRLAGLPSPTSIAKGVTGAIGEAFSGINDQSEPNASGARQWGGPVIGGGAYWVGEHGPELFRPNLPGSIIPNHQIMLGGLTINVMPGTSGEDAERLAAMIWDQATDALRAIVPAAG
jgi:tape measure domain-containing protein